MFGRFAQPSVLTAAHAGLSAHRYKVAAVPTPVTTRSALQQAACC